MAHNIYSLIYLLRGCILKTKMGKPLPPEVMPLIKKLTQSLERQ